MTAYRKIQIETARGRNGRPVICHRAVLREWPHPGATYGTIIEASSWFDNDSGLKRANRWRQANQHKEGPVP